MQLKKMKWKFGFLKNSFILLILLNSFNGFSQPLTKSNVVDQVAAVVGSNIILRSEIESQYQQYLQQGNYGNESVKCKILDQMLLNKLLVHQANVDSIVVDESQVMQKIDNNMAYFIQQIGSAEKLEQFYGKSIPELKEEFKPIVRDQLLAQQMQSKVTKSVTSSPADVKAFYNDIPKDSLPLINAEVEYSQIIYNIPISKEERDNAHTQIKEIRDRITKGEDFSTLAILYSQDIESAKQGGALGFVNRGDLVPAFEATAFRLKNTTEISEIVETQFGFHIMQLIERRGEKINVRHILIKPKTQAEDLVKGQQFMDSIAIQIRSGKITFAAAAEKFSDDTDTKMNGGNVMNTTNGATRFESDQVDPTVLFMLDKMTIGEVSNENLTTTREGKQAYRILYLKTRVEPHQMNLTDDYQKLQELTLNDKQNKTLEQWRNKKKALTYIKIADEYLACPELNDWTAETPKN
jgi:peptidyl-prolyl cis-trans isomerase SurA